MFHKVPHQSKQLMAEPQSTSAGPADTPSLPPASHHHRGSGARRRGGRGGGGAGAGNRNAEDNDRADGAVRGVRPPRGRGGRSGRGNRQHQARNHEPARTATTSTDDAGVTRSEMKGSQLPGGSVSNTDDDDADDGEVCFICASRVAHTSVSPCNHRTCHICALRLRALYKNKACAHCRVRF